MRGPLRCTAFATNRICHLNHGVRGVNDLPRRDAMDQGRLRRFRSQLASRAGGSREQPREQRSQRGPRRRAKTKTSNGQHYVLIRTAGSARCADEAAAAEDRRWWSDWVAWPGVGATEDGACRGGGARDPGRRGRPRRPTRYSLRQMRRNAARDFAGRSSRRRSASATCVDQVRLVSPSFARTGTRASRCPNRARAATRPRPAPRC